MALRRRRRGCVLSHRMSRVHRPPPWKWGLSSRGRPSPPAPPSHRVRPIPAWSACSTVCGAACPSSWTAPRCRPAPAGTAPARRGWRWRWPSPRWPRRPARSPRPSCRRRRAAGRGRRGSARSPWSPWGRSAGSPAPRAGTGCWTSSTPYPCRSRWTLRGGSRHLWVLIWTSLTTRRRGSGSLPSPRQRSAWPLTPHSGTLLQGGPQEGSKTRRSAALQTQEIRSGVKMSRTSRDQTMKLSFKWWKSPAVWVKHTELLKSTVGNTCRLYSSEYCIIMFNNAPSKVNALLRYTSTRKSYWQKWISCLKSKSMQQIGPFKTRTLYYLNIITDRAKSNLANLIYCMLCWVE